MSPRKPRRLRHGDIIAVISPAAAVQTESLQRGCESLERLGFKVRIGEHALDRHRFLAGADMDRAGELTAMFQDSEVRAVFCSRAGYGSGRLLPRLDLTAMARTPKIFLGFSDITFLLNAFVQRADMVCFHGPLVAGAFADVQSSRAQNHLLGLLTTGQGEACLSFPHTLRVGVGEGRLIGGCLSILVSTLGTPFAVNTEGAVLFIEDVGERPYRVDRMLTQLKQAGKLDNLAGVIFGEMSECFEDTDDPTILFSVIRDLFSDYAYPVGFGLPAGHGGENFTLPLGIRVQLDTVRQTLTFLEPAVE